MIKRDVLIQLRTWASGSKRKPLVLRGARQVGKTTAVDEFGKEFDNYIWLNLERKEDAGFFRDTDVVSEIMQSICFRKNILLKEGRTLLFIDEIQNEPRAVALLRYFYEDAPSLYVIAAGSRLQSLLKERVSFPVGRVEYLSMYPCSFGEYLDATGDTRYREVIDQVSLPPSMHEEVMKRFNRYTLIGGMPEIVAQYAEHCDLVRLGNIYQTLLLGYNEDVEKYAPGQKQTRIIRHILNVGWGKAAQAITLGNFGGSSYSSKDVREAFGIMEKAFLLDLVYPITSVLAPAIPSLRRAPKLIWVDTGLVNYAAGIQQEVFGANDILGTWQGAVAEHMVAQEMKLILRGRFPDKLQFWVRDKKGSNAEVDFIWQQDVRLIPIEVKAGHNAHLRSIQSFMDLSPSSIAIRVWSGAYSIDEASTPSGKKYRLINLPFYYVTALPEILKRVV